MRLFIFLVVLLTSAAAALEAQTTPSLREGLVGTWRLVAATQRMVDGSVRPDPQTGSRGAGYIMYDATGHVCVVLANPDRVMWQAPKSPTDAEVRSAFEGLVAYCGTYDTDEQKRHVTHHVEVDRDPQVAGTDRVRSATLSGNRLVLRPVDLPPNVKAWTVEWERVGRSDSRRP